MDHSYYEEYPRPRSPFAPWLLAALSGVVLSTATVAASFTTDSRDITARHQVVHGKQAL